MIQETKAKERTERVGKNRTIYARHEVWEGIDALAKRERRASNWIAARALEECIVKYTEEVAP